jgi:glutathione S-transferase
VRHDWAPRFVDFFSEREHRTPKFRQFNAMGEDPVLEHEGRTFTQSGVILDYLAERFGKFGWTDEDDRREILRRLLWGNHKLTSCIATLRFLLAFMQTGETRSPSCAGALGILDRHLGGRQFALFERPTIAELPMCGYLYWPDEFGLTWADHPRTWADHPHIAARLERNSPTCGQPERRVLLPSCVDGCGERRQLIAGPASTIR